MGRKYQMIDLRLTDGSIQKEKEKWKEKCFPSDQTSFSSDELIEKSGEDSAELTENPALD